MSDEQENVPVPIDPKFLPAEKHELNNDLSTVRSNQHTLIQQAMEAVQQMLIVADQSQHPRAYEVLANVLKTASELNKDLIETSEKKSSLNDQPENDEGRVINNNLFVGSMKELQDMLNKKNKPPDEQQ